MIADAEPDLLDFEQLRQALRASRALVAEQSAQMRFKQALIDKLTHENAHLKSLRWAASSEAYTAKQRRLFEEVRRRIRPPYRPNWTRSTRARRVRRRSANPNASRCRSTCRGATCATSLPTPPAAAARR